MAAVLLFNLPFFEDFERWRVADYKPPSYGYNFLLDHIHVAYSLLSERFRDTIGMSRDSFNDLE